MTKVLLVCGNCGSESKRRYIPMTFRCDHCGEGSEVESYKELEK